MNVEFGFYCFTLTTIEGVFKQILVYPDNSGSFYHFIVFFIFESIQHISEHIFILKSFTNSLLSLGWGAFLTYYKHTFNSEGEQACLSMIKKFSTDEPKISDYFSSTDDLAWSASICLHDDFFRTAVLLIKLRCFYVLYRSLWRLICLKFLFAVC